MFDWQNIVSRKTTSRYRVSIRSNHSVHFTLRINPCNKWVERMAVMGVWRPLSGQIVNLCGQWKCTFDRVWEFQNLWLWQLCLSKLVHFENWDTDHLYMTCMWTFHTNSLLHGFMFLMHTNNYVHLHKRCGTFYRDSVLMNACMLNNHKSWSLS